MSNNNSKSVICKCLNLLNIGEYRSLLADHRTRKLTTGKTIRIFEESQLAGRSSYDEIAEHLRLMPDLQDDNLKSSAPLSFRARSRLDADIEIQWNAKQKRTHHFQARLIEFTDEQQRTYLLLTNVYDRFAQEISEIYRYRWLIVLFFKWIKQHLRLVKLYSANQTAIWNQIYLALIAYSLVLLIKMKMQTDPSLWQILKRIRLYAERSWEEFQQAVFRPTSRPSKGRRKKGRQ